MAKERNKKVVVFLQIRLRMKVGGHNFSFKRRNVKTIVKLCIVLVFGEENYLLKKGIMSQNSFLFFCYSILIMP